MPLPTTSITSIDDYSPIYKGDTLKPFAAQFWVWDNTQSKYVPFNLAGLTLSLTMVSSDGSTTKGGAAWVVDDAANGKAHYPYQSTDVDTPGSWTLYIKLTDGTGKVVHADTKILEIKYAP